MLAAAAVQAKKEAVTAITWAAAAVAAANKLKVLQCNCLSSSQGTWQLLVLL
jgi:hypothetical protein